MNKITPESLTLLHDSDVYPVLRFNCARVNDEGRALYVLHLALHPDEDFYLHADRVYEVLDSRNNLKVFKSLDSVEKFLSRTCPRFHLSLAGRG